MTNDNPAAGVLALFVFAAVIIALIGNLYLPGLDVQAIILPLVKFGAFLALAVGFGWAVRGAVR